MVVDSSALVAILTCEPGAEAYSDLLAMATDPVVSAATLLETAIVLHRRTGVEAFDDLDDLVAHARIRCIAVDETQALAAREAWSRYGKGNGRAKLNFGDCFSYALAVTTGRPLLYKGEDFARTDVLAAAPAT
jgi:ribonuclease VapC